MHRTRVAAIAALGLAVALLAGCATPAAEPTASPSPSASATAEPTPSATPSASPEPVQDPADPTTWIVSAEGIGPYLLGAPLESGVAASPVWAPIDSGCGNTSVAFLGPAGATGADASLLLGADVHAEVVAVALSDPAPATVDGIRVGSTLDAMHATYPDLVASLRYGATPQFTLESPTGWITFQADESTGTVDLITVALTSTPPNEFCG